MGTHKAFFIMVFITILMTSQALLVVSCVSVDINRQEIIKAKDVDWHKPKRPFESFNASHVDKAWKNPKTGSSISYLSECNDPADPTLEGVIRGITSSISTIIKKREKVIRYNGKRAIHTEILSKVDGVPSKIEILVFKKRNCLFTLTFVALKQYFSRDHRVFNKFLEGFKVK